MTEMMTEDQMRVRTLSALAASAALALVLPGAAMAQGYYGSPAGYGYGSGGYGSGGYGSASYGSAGYGTTALGSGYRSSACSGVRSDRQAAGAVVGGLIGGLIGNGVAADGVRTEGSALGAVLGAAIGAGVAGDVDCGDAGHAYGHGGGYQTTGYGSDTGQAYGYGASDDSLYGGPSTGYGSDKAYRPPATQRHTGGYGYGYGQPASPAARECEVVYQVTTLPDGREIHTPVEACREAHYGDWGVRR